MFALNPLTGELKVLHLLDFEELLPDRTTHTFVVEAADGGGGNMPPGLASVTVTVTVRECLHFPDSCDVCVSVSHLCCVWILVRPGVLNPKPCGETDCISIANVSVSVKWSLGPQGLCCVVD